MSIQLRRTVQQSVLRCAHFDGSEVAFAWRRLTLEMWHYPWWSNGLTFLLARWYASLAYLPTKCPCWRSFNSYYGFHVRRGRGQGWYRSGLGREPEQRFGSLLRSWDLRACLNSSLTRRRVEALLDYRRSSCSMGAQSSSSWKEELCAGPSLNSAASRPQCHAWDGSCFFCSSRVFGCLPSCEYGSFRGAYCL